MSPRAASLAARAGSFFFFALEEADVLQQHHLTGRGLGGVQVGSQLHGAAQQAGKVGGHRRQGEFFLHHAPRWDGPDAKAGSRPRPCPAPCGCRAGPHGCALSLVMRPSFMGTLRSWRMTTVLPLHSMSCNSLMGMSASFLSGKGSPGRAGTRRPVCQKICSPRRKVQPGPEGQRECRQRKIRRLPFRPGRGHGGILGAHVTPCPFCCRVAGISAAARPVHAPHHLSPLDRTQQGPGPGDMSSCGPGP